MSFPRDRLAALFAERTAVGHWQHNPQLRQRPHRYDIFITIVLLCIAIYEGKNGSCVDFIAEDSILIHVVNVSEDLFPVFHSWRSALLAYWFWYGNYFRLGVCSRFKLFRLNRRWGSDHRSRAGEVLARQSCQGLDVCGQSSETRNRDS